MKGLRETLFNWFGITIQWGKGPEAEEVQALTNQFYVTLQAYLSKVEGDAGDRVPPALQRIREIMKKPYEDWRWQDAYDVEQQLALVFDEHVLQTELGRRLLEAKASLSPEIARWYEQEVDKADEKEKGRSIFMRLLNDLQWRYTKDEVRRGYIKQVTRRTELVFTLAVGVFLGVLLWVVANDVQLDSKGMILLAGGAGAFGAAFSMMTSLKSRLAKSTFDDLKLNRSWGLIFARILVGIGASFVLYFFVISGLLAGDAFPKLSGEVLENVKPEATAANFAKLFIWSFISGFSEKLLPNLLARTEGQVSEQAQIPPRPQGSFEPATVGQPGGTKKPGTTSLKTEKHREPIDDDSKRM